MFQQEGCGESPADSKVMDSKVAASKVAEGR